MDFFTELLVKAIEKGKIEVTFPELKPVNPVDLVEMKSYMLLCRIRDIVYDGSLSEHEIYAMIEDILCTQEIADSPAPGGK